MPIVIAQRVPFQTRNFITLRRLPKSQQVDLLIIKLNYMKKYYPLNQWLITLIIVSALSFAACDQDNTSAAVNEPETITTVTLSIYDQEAQNSFFATYTDPDGPGGEAATVEPISFEAGKAYQLLVLFYDDSGQEEVSMNAQLEYERLDHQVCFTTTGVVPEPLPQDFDENGNPVGKENFFGPKEAGSGSLQVTLLHQPDKAATDPCASGIVDVQTLAFPVTIN